MHNQWSGLTWDANVLGIDAASVLGLRMLKLSAGGAVAAAEADRMALERDGADAAAQTVGQPSTSPACG